MAVLSLKDIKKMIAAPDKAPFKNQNNILIRDTWMEAEAGRKGSKDEKLKYLCIEFEVIDPETGIKQRLYKAIRLLRVEVVPKPDTESISFMDKMEQVLSAVYECKINMITIIANIIEPVPLGQMFVYGVQAVGSDIETAKNNATRSYNQFIGSMQGTYATMQMRSLNFSEGEWLRNKMHAMKYITAVRGIPKANKAGIDIGNKGIGGSNLNPDSRGTLEELIIAMGDHEYVVEILSTPVKHNTLVAWEAKNKRERTEWSELAQGTKSYSFNMSLPMMVGGSIGQSSGWSKNYTDSDTVSFSNGQSFSSTSSQSTGESVSTSIGESFGISTGTSHSSSAGTSHSVSSGYSLGHNTGYSEGVSHGNTHGLTHGISQGQTIGYSSGISRGETSGISIGTSLGQSVGTNVGTSNNITLGQNTSQNIGKNYNQGISQAQTHSEGDSSTVARSYSESLTNSFNAGRSQNTSLSHSLGRNLTSGYNTSESVSANNGANTGESASQSMSANLSGGGSFSKGASNSNGNVDGTSKNGGLNINPGGIGISAGSGSSHSTSDTNSKNVSASFSGSAGAGTSGSYSQTGSKSEGIGYNQGFGSSASASSTESYSTTAGTGYTESYGSAYGQNNGLSYSNGKNISNSSSLSSTQSLGATESVGKGSSYSAGAGVSSGRSATDSQTISVTQSRGSSVSASMSQSISSSMTVSDSESASESVSNSYSNSYGESESQSRSTSDGTSQSQSYGTTQGESHSQSTSEGTGKTWGRSEGVSEGNTYSSSNGKSTGTSIGSTGGYTTGSSGSMGIAPSIGYNRAHQWTDQTVMDILRLLDYQNERYINALSGNGAFYTYCYIACPDEDALACAQAAAKSTWQNEYALVNPLQVLDLSKNEQSSLLYKFTAFSTDTSLEYVNGAEEYRYGTVLLPKEYVAYTHLPRVAESGMDTTIPDIPKFRVPANMPGKIYIGTVLNPNRFSFRNGYLTEQDYRLNVDELMHGIFIGASRSGKTVAAMRFICELAKEKRAKTGKRLRIICLDPKTDWRGLARFVEPQRYHFYSLGNPMFRAVNLNLCKVPKGVDPQQWMHGIVDIYCRCYGLMELGKNMITKAIDALYKKAGVYDVLRDDPNWDELVSLKSGEVTFAHVYQYLDAERQSFESPGSKVKAGNNTRDNYQRLLDRLSCFSSPHRTERKLFSATDEDHLNIGSATSNHIGKGTGSTVIEYIGDDDVIVFESYGLADSTFSNFVFGVMTSAIYKKAKSYERGYLDRSQYETVLVIEEANKVFANNESAGTGGGGGMALTGQSEFEEILDQGAGLGLFVISVTQRPSLIPRSIIANCGILFAGRLSDPMDKELVVEMLGRDPRIDDKDVKKFLSTMRIGWFIVKSSRAMDRRDAEAVLVQVAPLENVELANIDIEIKLQDAELEKLKKAASA